VRAVESPSRRIGQRQCGATLQDAATAVSASHSFAAHLSNPSSFVIQPNGAPSRSFPGFRLLLRSNPPFWKE